MPVHLVGLGSGLVLQLLHHGLHGLQVFGLGPLLVHAGYEVSRANVVQIIVQQVVVAYLAFLVYHRVGILLTVLANLLATIFKIGVKHRLQFYAHHVAPLGCGRKVQQIALGVALHLRVGHPLSIALVGFWLQHQVSVYHQVVIGDVLGLTYLIHGFAFHTVELTVLHGDVVHGVR